MLIYSRKSHIDCSTLIINFINHLFLAQPAFLSFVLLHISLYTSLFLPFLLYLSLYFTLFLFFFHTVCFFISASLFLLPSFLLHPTQVIFPSQQTAAPSAASPTRKCPVTDSRMLGTLSSTALISRVSKRSMMPLERKVKATES